MGGGREVDAEGGGEVVSRSARFSPARWCARYGPAQGGSRGRWASACSVRRPGFKPRTHDWASNVVPGTPRIRQNPPGWYVRGRQIRLSVPLLPLLPFTLFFAFFFSPVAKARQGGPSLYSFPPCLVRVSAPRSYFFLSRPPCMHASRRDKSTCLDILWNRSARRVFDPADDRNVANSSRSIVSILLDYMERSIVSWRWVDKCYGIFFFKFFPRTRSVHEFSRIKRKIFDLSG